MDKIIFSLIFVRAFHGCSGIQKEITLSHTNWLDDFEECFNVLFTLNGFPYYPKTSNNGVANSFAPIIYLKNFTPRLTVHFSRWTTCQTLSFTINLGFSTIMEVFIATQEVHGKFGFDDAYACERGHFCTAEQSFQKE